MTVTDDQQLGTQNCGHHYPQDYLFYATAAGKVHTESPGIHHQAILGAQWQSAVLVTIKSNS